MFRDTKEPQRLTNAQTTSPPWGFAISSRLVTGHRSVDLHWHDFYELVFVVFGEGTHVINGRPHRLMQGGMALLTPADFHEIYARPGSTVDIFNVIFNHEMLDQQLYHLLFSDRGDALVVNRVADFEATKANFVRLAAEAQHQMAGCELAIRSTLECVLIELARAKIPSNSMSASLRPESQHESVRRALIYIQHHFRGPLTLDEIASYVCLSPNYFSQCFHKTAGVPFQKYLQDVRLRFALSLLSVSGLSVTSVCHSAGFNTLGNFERAFRKKFGSPPLRWRRGQQASAADSQSAPRA